jgi:hypothetical protein
MFSVLKSFLLAMLEIVKLWLDARQRANANAPRNSCNTAALGCGLGALN